MGKVAIRSLQDAAAGQFPDSAGLSCAGNIAVRNLVTESDQSIHLRLYELSPGARIDIRHPPTGHAFYLWEGGATANGEALAAGGAVIVEHGGEASIMATGSGATIAHFQRNPTFAETHAKTGGHVHVIPPEGIFNCPVSASDAAYVIWADSSCPTCDLWLHQTHMPRPTTQGGHHFHSEDEVVFLVGGGMKLGNRMLQPGTALAIAADTIYGFGVPEGGTRFVNFRCRESYVVRTKNTKPLHAPINEREVLRTGGGNMKGLDVEVAGGFAE
jgi:hypothetical protein